MSNRLKASDFGRQPDFCATSGEPGGAVDRSRLRAVLATVMTVGVFLTPVQPVVGQSTTKTNIVFIHADDLGYGDLACYGADDVETPHIDGLARQGVRMTSYYAAGAECTPTRVGLLTGRYPQRAGGLECAVGTGNVGRYDDAILLAEQDELGLPPSQSVLGPALKEAGYATAVYGKWHVGYEPKFNPLNHGFDEFFGFLGGNVDYFTHRELSDLHVLYEDREPVERDGYMTHLITKDSVDFIRRHRGRPYFLYVAYNAPHFPFQGPDDDTGEMFPEDRWTEGTRAQYVELIEAMDRGIGRILKTLRKTGTADRTLVVFASDHGAMQPGSNEPFRGYKGGLFEGGIRTACIFRWPGRLEPGLVSDQPAITMDLTASFLRVAGTEPPGGKPLDGIDIIGHLEEHGGATKPRTLFWRARRGDRTWRAVRDGRLKYVSKVEGGERNAWMFDLPEDPGEQHSLVDERPNDLRRLKQRLRQWEREVRSPRVQKLRD